MSFEADLSGHLLGDSTLVALLASDSEGRKCVWPGIAPEGSPRPCVVHSIVAGDPVTDLAGEDNGGDGLAFYRVQIDAWARDFDTCAQIARQVRRRMNAGASTFASVPMEGSTDRYDYEPDTKLHRVINEFEVSYTPA